MFAVLLAGCGEEPGNKKPIKYSPTQKAGRVECVNLEINEWFDIEQYGKTIPVDHDEVRIKRGDFSVISKKPGVRPSLFSRSLSENQPNRSIPHIGDTVG